MASKTYVTKIEAAEEGGVAVSVFIESELGPVELEVLGELDTEPGTADPLVLALDQVRQKLADFGRDLQAEMQKPDVVMEMLRLALPPAESTDE